jgi:transposase
MNTHKNARLTPHGRALLARRVLGEGLRPEEVAQAQGVSVRTVYKWVRRYREEGKAGLHDRTSRPRRSPFATGTATVKQIIARRQQRQTYRQIAQALGIGQSTVARVLKRKGSITWDPTINGYAAKVFLKEPLRWDILALPLHCIGPTSPSTRFACGAGR